MMGFKAVHGLYCDCWDMYRRHCHESFDGEAWRRFMDELSNLSKKYGNEPLTRKTLLALFEEVERSQKRGDEGTGGER